MDRRSFLKLLGLSGAGAAVAVATATKPEVPEEVSASKVAVEQGKKSGRTAAFQDIVHDWNPHQYWVAHYQPTVMSTDEPFVFNVPGENWTPNRIQSQVQRELVEQWQSDLEEMILKGHV